MSYAVRAWRDGTGDHGITIGQVLAVGWSNWTAEFDLSESEIDAFLESIAAARQRAREATGQLHEPMPDAYSSRDWDG